jgi:hypothetical protein
LFSDVDLVNMPVFLACSSKRADPLTRLDSSSVRSLVTHVFQAFSRNCFAVSVFILAVSDMRINVSWMIGHGVGSPGRCFGNSFAMIDRLSPVASSMRR